MPEKKVARKSLILHDAHDPEGQRFKASPRNHFFKINRLAGEEQTFPVFSEFSIFCFT